MLMNMPVKNVNHCPFTESYSVFTSTPHLKFHISFPHLRVIWHNISLAFATTSQVEVTSAHV